MKAAIESPTATAAEQALPVGIYGVQISVLELAGDSVGYHVVQ